MKTFERARSAQQKELRMVAIVSAAERLFDCLDYETITLSAIAREAQFTRSNLYKYFKTREEIFLELLKRDLGKLSAAVERAVAGRRPSVSTFAGQWAARMEGAPRLLRLLSILHLQLEKGASLDSLVRFKQAIFEQMTGIITLLCNAFQGLTAERAEEFLAVQLATASGLYSMTHLSHKQKKAAALAGFGCYEGRFEAYFRGAAEACLERALSRSRLHNRC